MLLSEFDFPFDPSLIASEPVLPRDQARLLVLDPSHRTLAHRRIDDLPTLLQTGDLLVVNDTKVRSARVLGRKQPSGTVVEVLFVKELADRLWAVLMKGTLRPGQRIDVGPNAWLIVQSRDESHMIVRLEGELTASVLFERYGRMPLPPYIKRTPTEQDREWYQTVFAGTEGAIAAPTAGLHFTPRLVDRLAERKIALARVTLHVGIGTFKPVTVERIEDHRMGGESVEVGGETVEAIARTKRAGGKVVAVGTTVVRALESAAQGGELLPYQGETTLYITPGFSFRVIDALLTNFHLPKTTLLMLVSAVAGKEFLREAYKEALRERYRFYSYGDAMLILAKLNDETV